MKRKLLCALLCALLFAALALPAFARDYGYPNEIRANAVYLVCLDTGEVILQKNADVQVHPASLTKIMAAALAMELCDDLENTMVTVPENVWDEFNGLNISTAGLRAGEVVPMYDMICCMMLQSGNEAASAVRDYFGGDAFIDQMNRKAQELGCTNTHFSNPHGVFSDNHYTSAHDMALITEWALSVPGFWEISQMSRYTKAATNLNEEYTLVTTVLMEDPQSGYYTDYIKGIKTGTTDEAGRCLASAAQKDGMTYLLIVMGGSFELDDRFWSQGQSAFTETRLIYDWAFGNLGLKNVCDPDTVVTEIPLRHASKKDSLLLYPAGELYTVVNLSAEQDPAVTYELADLPEEIEAPVSVGQVIGRATVLLDGEKVGELELVSREEVELDRFVLLMDTIGQLLSSPAAKVIYVVLLVFAALYLFYALVIVPKSNRRRRRKRSGQSSGGTRRRR